MNNPTINANIQNTKSITATGQQGAHLSSLAYNQLIDLEELMNGNRPIEQQAHNGNQFHINSAPSVSRLIQNQLSHYEPSFSSSSDSLSRPGTAPLTLSNENNGK